MQFSIPSKKVEDQLNDFICGDRDWAQLVMWGVGERTAEPIHSDTSQYLNSFNEISWKQARFPYSVLSADCFLILAFGRDSVARTYECCGQKPMPATSDFQVWRSDAANFHALEI